MLETTGFSPDRRLFWSQHIRGAGLVALLIVLPVFQILLPRVGPFFGALAIAFCAFAQWLSPAGQKWSEPLATGSASRLVFFCLTIALAWAAITILWAHNRPDGFDALVTVCLGLFGGWFLAHNFALIPFERLPIVVLLGLSVGAASLVAGLASFELVQSLTNANYQVFDLNRIAIGLTVLAPVLVMIAKRSKLYAGASLVVFLLVTTAVFQSESESAKIAVIASVLAGLLVLAVPHARKAVTALLAATVIAMPFAMPLIETFSTFLTQGIYENGNVVHRLVIWKGYADQVMQHPWTGWGMKSDLHVGSLPETKVYADAIGLSGYFWSPHNMALELWINVGFVGVLPIAVALGTLGFLKSSDRFEAAALTSMVVAATSIHLTGSSGFQGWLITAYAIAGAVLWAIVWRNQFVERGPA